MCAWTVVEMGTLLVGAILALGIWLCLQQFSRIVFTVVLILFTSKKVFCLYVIPERSKEIQDFEEMRKGQSASEKDLSAGTKLPA